VTTTLWTTHEVIRGAGLCNVSLGGICCRLPAANSLHEDQPVRCAFTVKCDTRMLSVSGDGIVAWNKTDGAAYIGIAFTALDDTNRENLQYIVEWCADPA
jgi:hypothetical protein